MSLPSRPQLALVLNAHTPYIRHPRGKWCNDEYWFYDHLLDSYLPLLDLLERLESEGLPYRLALSLSPTLLEMWADPTLQERFAQYLERKIQLAERERERCIFELELSELIDYYASRLQYYQDKYENLYKRQIIPAWSDLAKKGRLELLTTGATSALLPLLYPYTSLIRAQIKVGLETFARHLGFRPRGFWLPECAFKPGLEELLAEEGLEYTHTTPCQNVGSVPPSACGGIAPIRNANSFVFFPNDAETEIELWSARSGYYTDFAYRNATRDLSDEWPQLDLGDFQLPDQERPATGFRYFHNGPAPENEYYNLEEGRELARLHAKVFWSNRQRQLARRPWPVEAPPLITTALNCEFLGGLWYEGFIWLEEVFRLAAAPQAPLELITPSQYLEYRESLPLAVPNSGSWLDGSFGARWLNCGNDWVASVTALAANRLDKMADLEDPDPLMVDNTNQALRELMLAQACDWPLLLSTGQHAQTARKKLRNHLVAFHKLYEDFSQGRVDPESLRNLRQRTPIFAHLDYRPIFQSERYQDMPTSPSAPPQPILNELWHLKESSQKLLELCQSALADPSSQELRQAISKQAVESVGLVETLAHSRQPLKSLERYRQTTLALEKLIQQVAQAQDSQQLESLSSASPEIVGAWSQAVEALLQELLAGREEHVSQAT